MVQYSELQSWHWDRINESGFAVGDKCWFHDVLEGVVCAEIKKFKIHWSGEDLIQVDVAWEQEYDDGDVFKTYDKRIDDYTRTILLDEIFHSKKDAIDGQIDKLTKNIRDRENYINYCSNKIKELNKLKNEC